MRVFRATGTGAIDETLSPDQNFRVHAIKIHLNEAGGEGDLTVTTDASGGAVYDTVVVTQDMTSIIDKVFEIAYPFVKGDKLDFAWPNANARTWGLEVLWTPEYVG